MTENLNSVTQSVSVLRDMVKNRLLRYVWTISLGCTGCVRSHQVSRDTFNATLIGKIESQCTLRSAYISILIDILGVHEDYSRFRSYWIELSKSPTNFNSFQKY